MPLESILVAGRQLQLLLPDPQKLLDDALTGEAQGTPGWDPYWGLLWAAAPLTAELIVQAPTRCRHALELGCGVGLTGIAALSAGIPVTFSDQSPAAVQMALENAKRNGFSNPQGLVFNWDAPPPPPRHWDFLFGSDILYDRDAHAPLLNTLGQLLHPEGVVWIGDAGRANAPVFANTAANLGWTVNLYDNQLLPVHNFKQHQFRLLILEHNPSQTPT